MSVNVGQRNVPDTPSNKMLYAVDRAAKLAAHTITICANPKIFLPEYQHITQEIVNTSVEIYKDAWTANNIVVKIPDDWITRRRMQLLAISKCNALLALIGLAKMLYHLRSKKVKCWATMTIETRGLLRKWHEADRKRYGDLLKQ
ncbi:MAG: hypothetical protein IJ899_20850 [Blautia sp.]|nr:hypothetical protein [Blautia sp.]